MDSVESTACARGRGQARRQSGDFLTAQPSPELRASLVFSEQSRVKPLESVRLLSGA